jgi:hypothetical protein
MRAKKHQAKCGKIPEGFPEFFPASFAGHSAITQIGGGGLADGCVICVRVVIRPPNAAPRLRHAPVRFVTEAPLASWPNVLTRINLLRVARRPYQR